MVISLRARMGLLLLAFFGLIALSVAATFWTIDAQKKDALVINLAGRQRMLIQQMTKEALQIEKDGEESSMHIAALQEASRAFDRTLWALINGGQVPYLPENTVTLPTTRQPDILAALYRLQQTWDAFRSRLEAIVSADPQSQEFGTATEAVARLSTDLLQQADGVVRMYGTASAQKIARLRWIQIVLFASTLALLALDSVLLRTLVVAPLHQLASAAERIGRGDLRTPVDVTGPQEIARLADSFDTMRAQLKASQEELVAWAEELEMRVTQRTRELAALHEVSREISSRLEIHHVLRSVTDKTRTLLDGDVALLCLLDETGQTLNLRAVSGPEEAVCRPQASPQRAPADRVLVGERALPCGDGRCPGCCGILAMSFRASHLAAPLWMGDRVLGALCVGNSQAGQFSGETVHLLTELANSAAIALENARLYEQAERMATLEERQRIAAEMHDGLAQMLSYLGLKVEQAIDLAGAGRNGLAVDKLHHIQEATEQTSQEVRRSITSLQRGSQPRQALQDRLAALMAEFTEGGDPAVELEIGSQVSLLLPPDDSEQVLRVVREALLNARRHARARQVVVRLERRGGEATITVKDNGQGFDPTAPLPDDNRHFGLSIMRARAARLDGRFTVESTPGDGTRATLIWPVERQTVVAGSPAAEGQSTGEGQV